MASAAADSLEASLNKLFWPKEKFALDVAKKGSKLAFSSMRRGYQKGSMIKEYCAVSFEKFEMTQLGSVEFQRNQQDYGTSLLMGPHGRFVATWGEKFQFPVTVYDTARPVHQQTLGKSFEPLVWIAWHPYSAGGNHLVVLNAAGCLQYCSIECA